MKGTRKHDRQSLEVQRACVTSACLCSLKTLTLALTEEEQQKLQGCENNWVQRITGTKTSHTSVMRIICQITFSNKTLRLVCFDWLNPAGELLYTTLFTSKYSMI